MDEDQKMQDLGGSNPENVQNESELQQNEQVDSAAEDESNDELEKVADYEPSEDSNVLEEIEKAVDVSSTEPIGETVEEIGIQEDVETEDADNPLETEANPTSEGNTPIIDAPETVQSLDEIADTELVEEVREEDDQAVQQEVQEESTNDAEEEDDQAAVQQDEQEESSNDADDTEEEDEASEQQQIIIDLSKSSKEEVLEAIQEYKNEEDGRVLDKVLKAAKPRFDELYEEARNEAHQSYIEDGNEGDGFEYNGDDTDKAFFGLYNVLKTRRNKYFKDLESAKEDNLKKKEQLLDQLREVIDGDETESSFNKVRDLQSEWKNVGPVPGSQNRTLWANYNALLDRFYDNRSIYFELKDLDRKKNLGLKVELCEKAEALAQLEDVKTAIIQLNDLHEEYKHVGPVPKEDQEPLWQRFKAASDAVYTKRKSYFDDLKIQFEKNYHEKQTLIQEVTQYLAFESDKITDWNKKTKEILEVQKKWELIGGVPREKAKEVNKAFWNNFKGFFANKNTFFKSLESQREENLEKKNELISKAEELMESDDYVSTADKLKHLQSQWKEIGPVPEKVRNETYNKFKAACDHFFNRRRELNKQQNQEYEENLKLKQQICDQLNDITNGDEINLDDIYDLVDNYGAIGFVPKNAIKKIQRRFDDAISKVLDDGSISDYDREDLRSHIQFSRMRNSPGGEGKLRRKENSLKRRISSIENDINTYRTNMQFFAKSKTADKMKAEFEQKIDDAKKEMKDLRTQLKALKQ